KRVEIGRQTAVGDLVVRQQRRLNVAGQYTQVADFRHHAAPQLALDVECVSELTRPSSSGLSVVIRYICIAVRDRRVDVRHGGPIGRAALQGEQRVQTLASVGGRNLLHETGVMGGTQRVDYRSIAARSRAP